MDEWLRRQTFTSLSNVSAHRCVAEVRVPPTDRSAGNELSKGEVARGRSCGMEDNRPLKPAAQNAVA
jgi:hypothetical protein